MNDYDHRKIAILGFGLEGESAAKFLLKNGASVSVFDEKSRQDFDPNPIQSLEKQGVSFRFGPFPDLSKFDLVLRSPGIRPDHVAFKNLDKAKLSSATKIFFDFCPCPIIGVTGTKGKGTTSSLIYEMLKEDGKNVFLGGNIGTPMLDFLDKLAPDSVVVLELSSFQLLDLHKSPHIAVMLMITSEHLDYHKSTEEYVDAKRNILRFQEISDFAVINHDYPASNESDVYTQGRLYLVSREQQIRENGCYIHDSAVWIKNDGSEQKVIDSDDIGIPGRHNLENVCAGSMAAFLAGVKLKTIRSVLSTFKGLPHRIEYVATIKGVQYYDDSFSTTPETAIAAIEAFDQPKVLILGGSGKNSDFLELGQIISNSNSIRAVIGIGEEWKRIKKFIIHNSKFEIPLIENCSTMSEIIQTAQNHAQFGDIVLLTPACASFGMFKNYKDRGEQFQKEIAKLK